jgi:hypothetical protein
MYLIISIAVLLDSLFFIGSGANIDVLVGALSVVTFVELINFKKL